MQVSQAGSSRREGVAHPLVKPGCVETESIRKTDTLSGTCTKRHVRMSQTMVVDLCCSLNPELLANES